MAPAVALASVLVLVLAASASARTKDDVRTTALRTVRTSVEDALALEGNALKQWNAGNKAQAAKELENAEQLLDAAPNVPVDNVVEIKGDSRNPSTVEYFDEVM